MERLVDQAAREMHIDPAELRKRNLIRPDAYPYQTRTGWIYDTGNYAAAMAKCQSLADWDGYAMRHANSKTPANYAAAASPIMSITPVSLTSAWKRALTRQAS